MAPRVERRLFGFIPVGSEPLRAGTNIAYPELYFDAPNGERLTLEGSSRGRVTKIGDGDFQVERSGLPMKYTRERTDGYNLEVVDRSRFLGIRKRIRWVD